MTVVWVVVGFFVVVAGLAGGVLVLRGRGESGGVGFDRGAGRDARARQQRYEAERHGDQGDTWQRGRESGG
ncbi:hypothetical protein OG400_22175 [Micromonospora ureilytica]|uniref:Secreted protein n=1 Tax=Micromonospora ureilytica TaxID=709868 RepID=A0ABS0JGP1_9ACTN|nr:hypothetical protein [Micromonospora ureilytica]WSR54494.1 hypothetical protein OG400_22175 [Micromonospora ureilytica]